MIGSTHGEVLQMRRPTTILRMLSITLAVWILGSVLPVGAHGTRAEPKIALLIGNSAYRESPLRNPVNDVRAMAKTLRELGFTVLAHENTSKRNNRLALLRDVQILLGGVADLSRLPG